MKNDYSMYYSASSAAKRKKKALHKVLLALAVLVIFACTYLLILPAFTLDSKEAKRQGGIDLPAKQTETAANSFSISSSSTFSSNTLKTTIPSTSASSTSSSSANASSDADRSDSNSGTTATSGKNEKGNNGNSDDGAKSLAAGSSEKGGSSVSGESTGSSDKSADSASGESSGSSDKSAGNTSGESAASSSDRSSGSASGKSTTGISEKTAGSAFGGSEAAKEKVDPFTTDKLPASATADKEKAETKCLTHSGNKYEIKVTYGKDAKIPEGSSLKVTDLNKGSKEYDYARSSVLADKKEKGECFDIDDFNLAAMDISIIDPNGKEIEPEASVQVDIKIKKLPGIDALSSIKDTIEIQHHVEAADGVVIEKVFDGKLEGAYEMDTEENIVSEGTVVDPKAVSDDDFKVDEDISVKEPTDQKADDNVDNINIRFGTSSFSTFTVTWGAAANNTTTNLRWRTGSNNNSTTRAQITVHYIDENGTAITRPGGINGNTDFAVGNTSFNNTVIISADNLAKAINGRTYLSAYTVVNGQNVTVTRVNATRSNYGNTTVTYYNGNTSVRSGSGGNNYNAGDLYLVYSGTSGNTATVHYVDEDGNELTIANTDSTYPNLNTSSSTPAYLIYDIDDYEYSYTYRNTNTNANRIRPQLQRNGTTWQYRGTNSNSWSNLSNGDDIYVVYKPKAVPTQGGTPQVDPDSETWPDEETPPDKPTFSKSSTNQGDGTNLISLTIKAAEKPVVQATPADVIVVFDRSYSMAYYNMSGGTSGTRRLAQAKTAVNDMADILLNGQNTDVRMALVTFGTDAEVLQGFTDNYGTFSNKVNGIDAPSAERTNWEKGLYLANTSTQLDSRDNAATFVVFVTDGDPTVRMSRGDHTNSELGTLGMSDSYYTNSYLFGDGNLNEGNYNACYEPAVAQVEAIAGSNKSFYAIGVSSDVTRLQKLMTDAGQPQSNAFICTNEQAMEDAFQSITESIQSALGFGSVTITDGITDLTHAEMKVMETVDPESFQYYRYGGEGNKYGADYDHKTPWTTLQAENCGLASYDESSGAVQWNMGDRFQLEDGVTYVVTFRVWPSQEAYDLVADLNNGVKVFEEGHDNSITPAEREQVVEITPPTETSEGTYSLKTNTDELNTTYKHTTKTGETVTVNSTDPIDAVFDDSGLIQNMALDSMKLTLKKEFEDELTSAEDRETQVTLILKRRDAHQDPPGEFADYAIPQGGTTSANIVLNASNNWTREFYVAPGFEVDGEVLEHGYDFTVTEPDIDYHYDLIEEIINPMVVNGQEAYYGDGYLIDDEAVVAKYIDRSLTAINRVKAGVDVQKKVYDVDGETEIFPDTEFTITGQLLGPDGNPYTWQNGDSVDASGAYHKYDKDGNRIVYKGHFADSSNITIKLKAGERIRFINVPNGCTFQFTEQTDGMDALGYEWKSTEASTQHRTGTDPEEYSSEGDVQPVVDGQTASIGSEQGGVVGDKQYSVLYSNKRTIPLPEIELVKVDADDISVKLNDAEFKLYTDEEKTEEVTVDGDGNELNIKTGNKDGSAGPDGWYWIGTLPAGTYYLYETVPPDSYELNETPVIITVTKNTTDYSVTATQDGSSVITYDADAGEAGLYTITVEDEFSAKQVLLKKVREDFETPLSGSVFDLNKYTNDAWAAVQTDIAPGGTSTVTDPGTGQESTVETGNPVDLGQLGIGRYQLTEKNAPNGYNILVKYVYFEVYKDSSDGKLKLRFTDEDGNELTAEEQEELEEFADLSESSNIYTITIKNEPGTELPESGGPGTTWIYLFGAILFVGSSIALASRRRMRRYS